MSDTIAAEPQHLRAMREANRVRLGRANLKAEIVDGRRTVRDVILDPPDIAAGMTAACLLMAQRRWGRHRTLSFLRRAGLSEAKTLESMTMRQRLYVAALLNGVPASDPFDGLRYP